MYSFKNCTDVFIRQTTWSKSGIKLRCQLCCLNVYDARVKSRTCSDPSLIFALFFPPPCMGVVSQIRGRRAGDSPLSALGYTCLFAILCRSYFLSSNGVEAAKGLKQEAERRAGCLSACNKEMPKKLSNDKDNTHPATRSTASAYTTHLLKPRRIRPSCGWRAPCCHVPQAGTMCITYEHVRMSGKSARTATQQTSASLMYLCFISSTRINMNSLGVASLSLAVKPRTCGMSAVLTSTSAETRTSKPSSENSTVGVKKKRTPSLENIAGEYVPGFSSSNYL